MTDTTEIVAEPDRHDIVMTRVFDAAPGTVFKALTDPKLVAKWWNAGGDLEIAEFDARPGGTYRHIIRGEDGNEYTFKGVFHDAVEGEMLVNTFEFEGLPGHVCLEITRLEALEGGRTKYTQVSVYETIEDRDGMASSMEEGARASLNKLAEVVESA